MLRRIAKEFLPPVLQRMLRSRPTPDSPDKDELELRRLAQLPPMVEETTNIFGTPFRIGDGRSFVHLYDIYFRRKSYAFDCQSGRPFIIDCGANIGVGVRWWKKAYPAARVLAFEADPKIFQLLEQNCEGLSDVRLINAAVWDTNGDINFCNKGGEGGRVEQVSAGKSEHSCIAVPAVRLRDYLSEQCDLLKMDIEGAEVRVIADCADLFSNIDRFFVEYHSFVGQEQLLGQTLSLLEKAGFRLHVRAENSSPRPFVELEKLNEKDLRLDLYCFRERSQPNYRLLPGSEKPA